MIAPLILAAVIQVSPSNPRYFETEDGKPWVPIGCNICFDRLYDGQTNDDVSVRARFDRWLRAFSSNGGNCIRLWAGHRSLEVMPDKPGVYDAQRTQTLKGIVRLCEELGIKIKITLESFRHCKGAENVRCQRNPAGVKFNYIWPRSGLSRQIMRGRFATTRRTRRARFCMMRFSGRSLRVRPGAGNSGIGIISTLTATVSGGISGGLPRPLKGWIR